MGSAGVPIFLQMTGSLSEVILQSDIMTKAILITLTVLSVVSWTIMIEKVRFFRRSRAESRRYLDVFTRERSLAALKARSSEFEASPEAGIAASVAAEVETAGPIAPAILDSILDAKTTETISLWESYLLFLATTASISPLLGLFGTVWGVMQSFLSMGVQGSASLFVVGPGIAEALITTIFGLGAAIPAVVGYNYIVRMIRRKEDELASFNARLKSRIIERTFVELERGERPRAHTESAGARTLDLR